MHKRPVVLTAVALLAGFLVSCGPGYRPGAASAQPPAQAAAPQREALSIAAPRLGNLGELKQQIRKYYACTCDCGCYDKEADAQSRRAISFLRDSVAHSRDAKLAIVLDIDETALSNYPLYTRNDFGHVPAEYDRWLDSGQAPAIPATLAIFNTARELGVAVFFISGRREDQRSATEQNLSSAGYKEWTGMTLRGPADIGKPASAYKPAARQKIVAAGYRLVLNVGDQMSDLTGEPGAELSIKLPNPMYFIP